MRSTPPVATVMRYAKPVAVVLAVLLASGGVAAVGPAGVGSAADADAAAGATASDVSSADVSATLDNGTVVVTVTADGSPVGNATVEVNDRELTTGADGTATVALDDLDDERVEELDVEVDADAFDGEVSYAVDDGSLDVLKEEYEYETDERSDDEGREADDEGGDEDGSDESEEGDEDESADDDGSEEADDDDEEADDGSA